MNIGILVYSFSGNTLSVAEKIKDKLTKDGHKATIERVTASNTDPKSSQPMTLKDVPKVGGYDKLIIGAPINAFSLCAAMKMYLKSYAKIKAKEINCFVTQSLKRSIFGGNQGIKQMSNLCTQKGGKIKNTAIVHWSSDKRDDEIKEAVKIMTEI